MGNSKAQPLKTYNLMGVPLGLYALFIRFENRLWATDPPNI